MSSIIQYLYKQTEEARDSYDEINKRITDVLKKLQEVDDGLNMVNVRLRDIEERLNVNRNENIN